MEKSSTDIWFVAFLMYKGLEITRYDPIAKNRVRCYFELTEEQWQKYRLEFNNSAFVKFKTLVEQVKDLAH